MTKVILVVWLAQSLTLHESNFPFMLVKYYVKLKFHRYNMYSLLTSLGDHRIILKVYVAGRESLTRSPRKGALETLFLVQLKVCF